MKSYLTIARIAFFLILPSGITIAELKLPQWSKEELRQLRTGELIPGSILLGDNTLPKEETQKKVEEKPKEKKEQLEQKETEQSLPEPELPSNTPLTPEILEKYYAQESEKIFTDPQMLLTRQETLDAIDFLEHHQSSSASDIRVVLFDRKQQLPDLEGFKNYLSSSDAGGETTAVVIYFLEEPSRAELLFTGDQTEGLSEIEQRRILENIRLRGLEKSEPFTQLESLLIQLSIRLFWVENEAEQRRLEEIAAAMPVSEGKTSNKPASRGSAIGATYSKVEPYVETVLPILLGSLGALISILGIWLWNRRKTFRFPIIEVERRLGANYGAGVGAVLGFHDRFGSPTVQKNQADKLI